MERNILSKSEDDYFSTRVVEYNNRKEKDEKEAAYIKGRTSELVWRICKETLFVPDDMISSVYISIHSDIDKIISAYRIAEKSFNHYLKQVCVYRLRRIRQKEAVPFYLEIEYWVDHQDEEEDPFVLSEKDEESNEESLSPSTDYSDMTMREVIEYIVEKNTAGDYPPRNEKEKVIRGKLESDKYFRRNFIFFILSLPFSSDETEAGNYARLFNTDENAFSHLLYLKNEIIRRNSTNWRKNMEKANKHWALMAKIKNSMYKASSREEYSMLKDNYMAQVRCHKNRLGDVGRSLKGIVHEEIASVLGQSRSTVSMGIKSVKTALMEISG